MAVAGFVVLCAIMACVLSLITLAAAVRRA
jgi:hypothetical protein